MTENTWIKNILIKTFDRKPEHKEIIRCIQMANTSEFEQKRMILFILAQYEDPTILIMIVNIILKDLNENIKLRNLALNFIQKTKYIDEYFVKYVSEIIPTADNTTKNILFKMIYKFMKVEYFRNKYDIIHWVNNDLQSGNINALNVVYNIDPSLYNNFMKSIVKIFLKTDLDHDRSIICLSIFKKYITFYQSKKNDINNQSLKANNRITNNYNNKYNISKRDESHKEIVQIDTSNKYKITERNESLKEIEQIDFTDKYNNILERNENLKEIGHRIEQIDISKEIPTPLLDKKYHRKNEIIVKKFDQDQINIYENNNQEKKNIIYADNSLDFDSSILNSQNNIGNSFELPSDEIYQEKPYENLSPENDNLDKLCYDNNIKQINSKIQRLVFDNKFEISYLASKILIELKDNTFLQEIYNRMLRNAYINKNNNLIEIYKFIRELILKFNVIINYRNEDFVIFNNDSTAIACIKLDILSLNINEISTNESNNAFERKSMLWDCLYVGMKTNMVNPDIVKKCFYKNQTKTLKIIFEALPFDQTWNFTILSILKETKIKTKNIKILLPILAYVIEKNEKIGIYLKNIEHTKKKISLKTSWIEFYVSIHRKGLISNIELEEIIKKFLVQKINNSEKGSFFYIQDKFFNLMEQKKELLKANSSIKYLKTKYLCLGAEVKRPIGNSKNTVKNIIVDENKGKILDHVKEDEFEYRIFLDESNINLEFINLKSDQIVSVAPFLNSFLARKPINVVITTLNNVVDNINLDIKIENWNKTINITLIDLITPIKMNSKEFNRDFSNIKYYEIIMYHNFIGNVEFIDESTFAFKVVDLIFYGMCISGQIVLKCKNKGMLKKLVNCFLQEK